MKYCCFGRSLRIRHGPGGLGKWRCIVLPDHIARQRGWMDLLKNQPACKKKKKKECGRHTHLFRTYCLPCRAYILAHMKCVNTNYRLKILYLGRLRSTLKASLLVISQLMFKQFTISLFIAVLFSLLCSSMVLIVSKDSLILLVLVLSVHEQ